MTYSHRNGETTPPTVEGNYWTRCPYGEGISINLVLVMRQQGELIVWHMGDENEFLLSTLNRQTQWWGPITPPWEQAK